MANSTPLHMFSHLVARTRSNLIAWHSNGLNSLDRELRYTELKINDLESSDSLDNPDQNVYLNLKIFYNKYNALLGQNSLKWAQHSRLMWIKNRDFNTSFFHNSAHIHRHRNLISHIVDGQSTGYTSRESIENCFLQFQFLRDFNYSSR